MNTSFSYAKQLKDMRIVEAFCLDYQRFKWERAIQQAYERWEQAINQSFIEQADCEDHWANQFDGCINGYYQNTNGVWFPGCANLNPPPNDIDTGRDYTTEMCVQECIKTRDEGLAECERKYEKLRELINNDYSKEIFQLYLAMAQALENCRTSRTGTGLGSATPAAGETGTDMVKRVAGISATLKSSISTKPENSVNWASPIVYPYSEYYAETVSEYLTANKSNKPAPQTVQKQLPIQKPDEPGSEI